MLVVYSMYIVHRAQEKLQTGPTLKFQNALVFDFTSLAHTNTFCSPWHVHFRTLILELFLAFCFEEIPVSFPFFSVDRGRICMCLWSDNTRTLITHMEERVWTKHYFSVHFTTNIGDVKLSTNVVYGRNGLWMYYHLLGLGVNPRERSFFHENDQIYQERSHRSEKKNEHIECVY